MSERICRHLVITGKVQGVCYRASAQEAAQQLGLSGWVRNRHNGSVEAVVCGAPDIVADFIAWANEGPPAARVAEVVVSESTDSEHDTFEFRPTA